MVGESLLDEEPIGSHFKESMGLFKEVDSEGCEAYAAYWTDGRKMLTCQTYDDDKKSAEWVLNYAVLSYWLKELSKKRLVEDFDYTAFVNTSFDSIRSYISKHYSRKDYGE